MNARLKELLTHLSETLTVEREREIEDLHRRALAWEPVDRLPLVLSYPAPPGRLQPFPHAETLADPEKMLFNELVSAWGTSLCHREEVGDDLPGTVRANFGTGLVASMFGARIEQVDDNPPWVRPLPTQELFREATAQSPADCEIGWVPRVLDRYRFYQQVLADFPSLLCVIKLVLPDLQGPLDTVELLRGSDLYLDFYTEPELIDGALQNVATAQIQLARHLEPLLTDGPPGWSHQHGCLVRGRILLRVDSAVMLSPSMYRDQVKPHDERVLRELGGGGLHSCGNFAHHAAEYLSLPSVRCLDLGQPRLNDLDSLYALARERSVALVRVDVDESELLSGSVLRRFPTGVTLFHEASSMEHARQIMKTYLCLGNKVPALTRPYACLAFLTRARLFRPRPTARAGLRSRAGRGIDEPFGPRNPSRFAVRRRRSGQPTAKRGPASVGGLRTEDRPRSHRVQPVHASVEKCGLTRKRPTPSGRATDRSQRCGTAQCGQAQPCFLECGEKRSAPPLWLLGARAKAVSPLRSASALHIPHARPLRPSLAPCLPCGLCARYPRCVTERTTDDTTMSPRPTTTAPGKARYIMIGGFLGAGKTTAVAKLARRLSDRGLRVGLITNDQGRHLVDTAMLRAQGFATEEIPGGCFCCRFNSLVDAAHKLIAQSRPDVFIAEPVGSCTDLVATVTYPLRRLYGEKFIVAPVSVLVDPLRALRILGLEKGGSFSDKVLYIYNKQLEEADLIVISKCDLLRVARLETLRHALATRFPSKEILAVSCREGTDLDEWFERITTEEQVSGSVMNVDYDTYADGEALLGWLNCTVQVTAQQSFDADQFLTRLAAEVQQRLQNHSAEIAHLKMTLSPDAGLGDIAAVNVVRNDVVPELSLHLDEPIQAGQLIINLRAEASPEVLGTAVQEGLTSAATAFPKLQATVDHLEHFRPGRPNPTHRFRDISGQ